MALPRPDEHWSEPAGAGESGTDWDSLRNDLEALLHQVENRHLRTDEPHRPSGSMLRDDDQTRHRAALRSVQRAVERFAEPRNSGSHEIESAISEIRARTSDTAQRAPRSAPRLRFPDDPRPLQRPMRGYAEREERPVSAPAAISAQRSGDLNGLKQLTAAVSGMAGRLERLEADMRATRDASADMTEIAAQVGQLTHVVELIAGAVGEQGQVKRLESQIADLARLYSEGSKPEISALSRRLDELGATVERLADFQVREMGRFTSQAEGVASSQSSAMQAIEDGVRNIYDRIDTLESSYAVAPEDLDRLTREMAAVTEALRSSGDGAALSDIVARLEGLSHQIDGMGQSGDMSVSALRDDVEALREAVGDAVAPRFAALEKSIAHLSSQVGGTAPGQADITQLEAQISRLAQRMDQTGQQLSGLTELYKSEGAREGAPDIEALAALVAERTSKEFARLRGDDSGFDADTLGALESRLSKLFASSQSAESTGLLASVADNLKRVDERLNRLESALSAPASAGAASPAPAPRATAAAEPKARVMVPAAPPAAVAQQKPRLPAAEPNTPPPHAMRTEEPRRERVAQQSDSMPHAPNADRPLVDTEMSALGAPVEDWSSLGLDEERVQKPRGQGNAAAAPVPPGFDATQIEKPARPKSSFVDEASSFTPIGSSDVAPPDEAEQTIDSAADRNTFIAAARRAARGNAEAQDSGAGSQSLIGRALARFQSGSATEGGEPANKSPMLQAVETGDGDEWNRSKPATPAKVPKKSRSKQAEPVFDAPPESRATLDDFSVDAHDAFGGEADDKPGLLTQHRRSLLLAAALVVTILLAGNLVLQRLSPADAGGADMAVDAPTDGGAMVDPTPTGSIDPMIEMSLTQPSPTRQILPQSLTQGKLTSAPGIDETFTHSVPPTIPAQIETAPAPIKLDLPPDAVGPLDLRQAAADGDARAQFEIGAIYTEGSAVPQDFKAAATWYERSAAQGFAPAQYRLGNLYEHGNGVDKDLEQARLWYSRAAEAGNRLAMHNLASLYASGQLGDQQFASAAEWFERASEAGMTDSQFNLGMLYARGLGVTQDLKTSYKWFSLAAEEGDKDAAKARDDIGKSLDASALAEIKADIAAWHMAPINIPANFAPIGTWSASFDPGQTIIEKGVTEGVQRALARLGYDPGTIDGVMGPKTTQAISAFERATGMQPTGLVNPRLLAVLGSQPV